MGCRFNQSCLCGGCGFFDLVFLSVSVLQKANPFFEAMDSVYALSALRKKIQGRYVKQVFHEKARKPAYRFSEKQECSIALRSTGRFANRRPSIDVRPRQIRARAAPRNFARGCFFVLLLGIKRGRFRLRGAAFGRFSCACAAKKPPQGKIRKNFFQKSRNSAIKTA